MRTEEYLRKLEPLLRDKVSTWRRNLELADPEIRRLLEKQIAITAFKKLGSPDQRPFLSLPPEKTIKAALNLGTILYGSERWQAGLQLKELLQNVSIFGRSGAGKTNLAFHLLLQLVKKRVPVLFLDWKRTARHLLPLVPRMKIYTPGRKLSPFPFNPFLPPPGIDEQSFARQLIDVIADAFVLGVGSKSLIEQSIYRLTNKSIDVTLYRVIKELENVPDKNRVSGWKTSALRALNSLKPLVTKDHWVSSDKVVQELTSGLVVLELDGLSQGARKFLVPLLSLWLYQYRLQEKDREELRLATFVEEAHHIFFRHENTKETLMETLIRQCREIGIGMVIVDQHPSLVSHAVLGNTYASLCLNLKNPSDINKASQLSQLPDTERGHLSNLQTGHAIAKLQDRWKKPFLITTPLVEVKKGSVTDEQVSRRMQGTTDSLSAVSQEHENERVRRVRKPDNKLNPSEMRFIQDVVDFRLSGVKERYKRLGISSDKGTKIKGHLVRTGWLEQATIPVGKTRMTALRATRKAREVLGGQHIERQIEGIEHAYWKEHYKQKLKRKGYEVQEEAPRKSGGRVDLLAVKEGKRLAVEIETGKSNVTHNVRSNLESGFQRVLVVCTTSSALRRVRRQLAVQGPFSSLVVSVEQSR